MLLGANHKKVPSGVECLCRLYRTPNRYTMRELLHHPEEKVSYARSFRRVQ